MTRERDQRGRFVKGVRPKGAGRPKGVPNKRTLAAEEILQKSAGRHPLETLLLAANGEWEKLGYDKKSGGLPSPNKRLEMQISAATQACQFLIPKKKSVEVTSSGEALPVIIVPDKAPGSTWQEKAAIVREEQQKRLQEKRGG